MSDSSASIKWEILLEEKSLDENQLPDKVKAKIDKFNEQYAEYEDTEEGSEEEARLEVALQALDEGIVNEINAFIKEKEASTQTPPATPPATPPVDPASQNSDDNSDQGTPSWKWW